MQRYCYYKLNSQNLHLAAKYPLLPKRNILRTHFMEAFDWFTA